MFLCSPRVESNLDLLPIVSDLADAVRQSLSALEMQFPPGLQLQVDLGPNAKPVKAEAARIRLAATCLCRNALEAMPNGGVLLIEIFSTTLNDAHPKVFLGDARPGEYTVLAVSDSGPGMDPSALAHIFEMPPQVEGAETQPRSGLCLVRDIASWCGGHVWVYSEPGHGTQFEIFFPVV